MKKDLVNRQDIVVLVNSFYEKVQKDEVISHFFSVVVPVDWATHLPRMYDFWENIVFQTKNFEGNPIRKHQELHQLSPLQTVHFERWLALFTATVDELFEGNHAEIAKQRAMSIATVMRVKISNAK